MEKKNNEVLSGVYVAPKAKAFEIKLHSGLCQVPVSGGYSESSDFDGDNNMNI